MTYREIAVRLAEERGGPKVLNRMSAGDCLAKSYELLKTIDPHEEFFSSGQ